MTDNTIVSSTSVDDVQTHEDISTVSVEVVEIVTTTLGTTSLWEFAHDLSADEELELMFPKSVGQVTEKFLKALNPDITNWEEVRTETKIKVLSRQDMDRFLYLVDTLFGITEEKISEMLDKPKAKMFIDLKHVFTLARDGEETFKKEMDIILDIIGNDEKFTTLMKEIGVTFEDSPLVN